MIADDFKSLIQAIGPVLLLSNSSTFSKIFIALVMFFANVLGSSITKWAKTAFDARVSATMTCKISGVSGSSISFEYCQEIAGLNAFIHNLVIANKVDASKLIIVFSSQLKSALGARNMPVYLMHNTNTFIDLNDDVYCNIFKTSDVGVGEDKKQITTITVTATMYSRSNNAHSLMEMMKVCRELEDKTNVYNIKSKEIQVLQGFSSENIARYNFFDFQSEMSFDKLFFPGKSRLITILDEFANNKARYTKLGIPYTLGLLFHGAPGTGKTSAIKAISKYTDRSIVCVDPNKVDTRAKLLNLLKGCGTPSNIYVFEEIDCGLWKDIIMGREAPEQKPDIAVSEISAVASLALSALTKDKKDDKPELSLKLSDILDILDGMIDMSGRMIIMTTNHPQKLDPALLRPGRIDHVIEFKNLTRDNVSDLYKLWFGEDLPRDVFGRMQDYRFSQAEIGNMFKKYSTSELMRALTM